MDLLGDMAADRQIKGDAAVSDGNCEGGQTGAAEFSVLLASRHKVTVTRSGVVHEGTHGGGSYAGGLGLHLAVVQVGEWETGHTAERGPGTD